ncbi:serine/threonine-protein kinase [Gordonia sp. FQ]|uniref:serine/threonine-protein kinase n=1 Tax=Gordonia sp. FQ TaxID=3446634 RepID=UPI003F875949
MSLEPGAVFAGYRVIAPIGRGGMGEVYLVENPGLARREALKLISTAGDASSDFAERFAREARTAAALHHPGIVTVYQYGVEGGRPWFTMRHLDGTDLTGERLSTGDVLDVAGAVADALDYAHAQGVVHRDIKPANILMSRRPDGRVGAVTVLDFGIARLADSTSLTGTGNFIGTLRYSAPEVIEGAPATAAADQYSLACTLYELLTGAAPFTSDNPVALIRAHADHPAPPVSSRRPDLAALDPVFARALAKDPAGRFPDCRSFAAELRHALARPPAAATAPLTAPYPAPAPASPPPVPEPSAPATPVAEPVPTGKRRSRAPLFVGLAILVIAGLAIALAIILTRSHDDRPAATSPVTVTESGPSTSPSTSTSTATGSAAVETPTVAQLQTILRKAVDPKTPAGELGRYVYTGDDPAAVTKMSAYAAATSLAGYTPDSYTVKAPVTMTGGNTTTASVAAKSPRDAAPTTIRDVEWIHSGGYWKLVPDAILTSGPH